MYTYNIKYKEYGIKCKTFEAFMIQLNNLPDIKVTRTITEKKRIANREAQRRYNKKKNILKEETE